MEQQLVDLAGHQPHRVMVGRGPVPGHPCHHAPSVPRCADPRPAAALAAPAPGYPTTFALTADLSQAELRFNRSSFRNEASATSPTPEAVTNDANRIVNGVDQLTREHWARAQPRFRTRD